MVTPGPSKRCDTLNKGAPEDTCDLPVGMNNKLCSAANFSAMDLNVMSGSVESSEGCECAAAVLRLDVLPVFS